MEEDKEYSLDVLQKCSYRFLQQMAKLLNLPCHVKKIHLINLIYTKKHKRPEELELLIKKVKLERLHKCRLNSPPSNELQNKEMPISENANQSPPISQTPKRPDQIAVVCNPDINYYQKSINTNTLKTYPPQQNLKCDRVLRSSSLRTKHINASNLLNDKLKSPVNLENVQEAFRTINKNKNFTSVIEGRRQYARTVAEKRVQYHKSLLNKSTVSKRHRTLSGITPLDERTKHLEKSVNYKYVHNFTIRSPNGTYNTIRALVKKPVFKPCIHDKATQLSLPEVPPMTSTDSIEKNNNQNSRNAERYPNLSSGANNDKYVHVSKVHNKYENIQYYCKKTRAECVNNLRFSEENGNSDNLPKGTVSLLRPNSCVANVTDSHLDNSIIQYNDRAPRNIGPRKDNKINNTNNEFNRENGYVSRNYVFPGENVSIYGEIEHARNNDIPNANEYPRYNTDVPVNHENAKNSRSIPRDNIIPSNDGRHRNNTGIPIIRGSKNSRIISKINRVLPSYDEFPTKNYIIPINYNNANNNKQNPRINGVFHSNHELSRENGSISMYQEYSINSETIPRIKNVNNNGHLRNDSSLHNINHEFGKNSGTSSGVDGIMSNAEFPRNNNNIVMNRGNARNNQTIPRINSVIPRNYEFPGDSGSFPVHHEHARYNSNIPINKELLSRNNGNMTVNTGCPHDYERIRKDREYARIPRIIPINNEDPKTNRNISKDDISTINNVPRDYSNMHMDHDYARKYGVTPSNNVCTPVNGGMNMITSISKINESSHDYVLNDEYAINVKYYPLNNGYSRNEKKRNSAYSSRNHEYPRSYEYPRTTEVLPRISSVFSKFNKVNYYNANEALYININKNNTPPSPHFAPFPQSKPLEVVYNYKKQCIIDDPIVYPVTVSALTQSIYSRSVVMTACVQASSYEQSDIVYRPPQHSQNTINSEPERFERTATLMEDIESSPDRLVPESCDATLISATPAEYYEITDNTIPNMVEDAMEIISQDGDYLERCGIDVRMQCILCSWAGAKITLEHHIRRTHSALISTHALDACSATYCLRSVPRAPRVSSRILDMRGALIALCVTTHSPTDFRASLAMITHEAEAKLASITVLNKLTGEPYTWDGVVQQLSENFPFDIESCLDIDLRKTNQIPSNSNMDEINKQLDITSPTQVFFGPPDSVTDTNVTLHIQIY